MKTLPLLSALCLAAIVAAGCKSSGDSDEIEASLTVRTPNVPASRGQQFADIKAGGKWTLDIVSEGGDWLSVSQTGGSGSATVVLSYEANTTNSARTSTLTLYAGSRKRTAVLTQAAGGSENQGGGEGGEGGGEGGAGTQPAWLELPALSSGGGLAFYSHNAKIGSKTARSFSFSWDKDNLVARWVAYPLNSWYIGGNIKRTDAWGYDPIVPASDQPLLQHGYSAGSASWKARGHQIPSADRLYDYASNAQTFYYTNMTPQIQDNFNGGIWADLEDKVRSWARSSDTLYVVTGCMVDKTLGYVRDNNGRHVSVPSAYFKAVLRYSKTSTIGFGNYAACGVYLEHKEYQGGNLPSGSVMSIDALEKKTGLDFFASLPALVGESAASQIESQNPETVSWWGF